MNKLISSLIFLLAGCVLSFSGIYAQNPTPSVYTGTTVNFVRTWQATAPETSPTNLVTRPVTDVKQNTDYYNALGMPLQTVTRQASPLGNDMVAAHTYDTYGREVFSYLPFVSNAATAGDVINDGKFKPDAFQQQASFYNTLFGGLPGFPNMSTGDAHWPYSQQVLEASPLNRVLNTYAPGTNWVGSQSGPTPHTVQGQSMANTTTDNVQMWNIAAAQGSIPQSTGAYPAGQLYKAVVTDEQGHQVISFTDTYGQLILKKIQNTAAPDNGSGSGHANWICTYYVYDDYGNLRTIIPPALVQQIDGTWSISQTNADEFCYRFEYDLMNRMVIKKTPGTPSGSQGEVWMVYDVRNRLVMQQDGNMRPNSQWMCTIYDNLDRPVTTGTILYTGTFAQLQAAVTAQTGGNSSTTVSGGSVPANIQADLLLTTASLSGDFQATQSITLNPGFNTQNGFIAEIVASPVSGAINTVTVNNNPVPTGSTLTPLTATFYDNYNWVSSSGTALTSSLDATNTSDGNYFVTSFNSSPVYAVAVAQSRQIRGQVTGHMEQVMGGPGGYQYTSIIYDDHARVIQSQNTNITGGKDLTTNQYDWSGKQIRSLTAHNKAGINPQNHLLSSAMNYDAMGRLQSIIKAVNSTINGTTVSAPATTIVANQFTELGQLQQKVLGNNMETEYYDYNIRGWLLGMNRFYARSYAQSQFPGPPYFGYDLGYDQGVIATASGEGLGNYATPLFNGTIAGTVWRSKGDNQLRKYDYTYDPATRLVGADFNQWGGGFSKSAGIDFSVNSLSYDANGNIKGLSQNGWLPGGSQNIDNLAYTYQNSDNSNRLKTVLDNSAYNTSNPNSTLGDFHYAGTKNATTSVDYGYDNNGNITSDANRLITGITYDYRNQPQQMTITGKGSIQYLYDATGAKLKKIATDNSVAGKTVTTTTTYLGSYVYQSRTTVPTDANNPDYTDVLQFIGDEEGRIRFKPAANGIAASYVFDYFIRDQVNNVRMVLTDEVQQDIFPAATIETSAIAAEQGFYNITNDAAHVIPISSLGWFPTASNYPDNNGIANPGNPNAANPNAQVYKLNGNTGDKYGLGITLKVMSGDQISIFAKSIWHNNGTAPGSYPISSVIMGFINAFAGTSAVSIGGHGAVTGASLNGNTAFTQPLSSLLNNTPAQSDPSTMPKAAINWILFDDQFNPVSVGTDLVSGTPDVIKLHGIMNQPMASNGYLYVYCSNESALDVYFDNLQVVNTRGPILEENHYYPTGLVMAGISDKAWNKLPNYFHYQDNEMQNKEFADGTGLEEHDFHARFYDQQLGVWHNQDPGGQYASPYMAMGNNWPNGTDPNGKWFGLDDLFASVIGGLYNLGSELLSGNVHNFMQGVEYFGVGAASGEASLYGGPAAGGAILGAGNALVSGANSGHAVNWSNVAEAGFMGGMQGAMTAGIGMGGGGSAGWGKVLDVAIKGAERGVTSAIVSDIFNGNAGNNFGITQIWRSAVAGAALAEAQEYLGSSSDEGGLGLKDSHVGSILYNAISSAGKSVGSNWANGDPLFSKVNVALGPVTLTFGKGQVLFQAKQNISLLGNLFNAGVGGLFSPVDWGFTRGGVFRTDGGFLGDLSNMLNRINFLNIKRFQLGTKYLIPYFNPGDGTFTSNAGEEASW